MINDDKLIWIYTDYGHRRLTEMMANPEDLLHLYKFKVGDANGEYYIPDSSQTELVNIKDYFYIHTKSINKDLVEVTLTTVITENSTGYEIREIGLYETVDNVDYLFAICTSQPILKPTIENNYVVSVDYEVRLRSQNLCDVYDRIILNAESEYMKESDLSNLKLNILYIEGNLMDQISSNTHILGLNRAQQLNDKVENNFRYFSNIFTTLNFTNLINLSNIEFIKSYWIFNYTNNVSGDSSVIDLSKGNKYLDTNKPLHKFDREFIGLAPFLNFGDNDDFSLPSSIPFKMTQGGNDLPFTFLFLLEHNSKDEKNTIISKADKNTNKCTFDITKLQDSSLVVRLYSDANNYVMFKTGINVVPTEAYALAIRYNGESDNPKVDIFINNNKISVSRYYYGSYSGMTDHATSLCSYVLDSNFNKIENINSKISTITKINDNMPDTNIKSMLLNLMAFCGKDICLIL